MQNLDEFSHVVDQEPRERRRLQQLSALIPRGYGSGEGVEAAAEEEDLCEAAYVKAQRARKKALFTYNSHTALLHEERAILQSLGLTANLFRKDSQ